MNIYDTPTSDLVDSIGTVRRASHTLLAIVLCVPLVYVSLYCVASSVVDFIFRTINFETEFSFYEIDMALSWIFLTIIYFVIYNIKSIYPGVVVWICAVFLTLYWAVESGFVLHGLNPMYPAWYEVGLALSHFVIALTFSTYSCFSKPRSKYLTCAVEKNA